MYTIKELESIVNSLLAERAYEEEPIALFEPITYALSKGGKRLRPVMMLLASQMYDGDLQYATKPALGIELFHNFTLLHDDVMDNADLRRGKPTVHKKWNENVAILSGDAMSIKAYQYIVDCKETHVRDVLKVFNNTALEVCKGQQLDMEFEEKTDVSMEEYLLMIRYKTAVLFACSLKIGGILANADQQQQNLLYELGINLGMAFQLQDDYLDTYGDVAVFGKNIGGDILAKKKTYLMITALEQANDSQRVVLLRTLENNEISSDDKINSVTILYNQLGVKAKTGKAITNYIELAKKNLSDLNIPNERKDILYSLIQKLENRTV